MLDDQPKPEPGTPANQESVASIAAEQPASQDAVPAPKTARQQVDPAPAAPERKGQEDQGPTRSEYEIKFINAVTDLTGKPIDDQGYTSFLRRSKAQERCVIARFVNLTSSLGDFQGDPEGMEGIYRQAYFATQLLSKSQSAAADSILKILDDIEFRSSRKSPIYCVVKGLRNFALCFIPLALVYSASYVLLHETNSSDLAEVDILRSLFTKPMVIAGIFGVLGSVVSILLRLSEFEGATRRSRRFLTTTGAMLPLVGGIFACVTFALFASGIVNFNFAAAQPALHFAVEHSATDVGSTAPIYNIYFYMVVGFLSGFSERFTRGLLGTAETTLAKTVMNQSTKAADGTTEYIAAASKVATRK